MATTRLAYYIRDNQECAWLYKKNTTHRYPICTILNAALKGKDLANQSAALRTVLDWLTEHPDDFTLDNINKIGCALCHKQGKPALSPFDIDTHPYSEKKPRNEKLPSKKKDIPDYLTSLCSFETPVYSFYRCTTLLHSVIATLACMAEQGFRLFKCAECGKYFAHKGRKTKSYCDDSCKNKNANRQRLADKTKKEIHDLYKTIVNYYHPKKANQKELKKEKANFQESYRDNKSKYDKGEITKDELLAEMMKYYHGKEKK